MIAMLHEKSRNMMTAFLQLKLAIKHLTENGKGIIVYNFMLGRKLYPASYNVLSIWHAYEPIVMSLSV